MDSPDPYGDGDATFRAAGGEAGIRKLVDAFYDEMSTNSRYAKIFGWHTAGEAVSRDKLARFLCGWMGGPRLYQQAFGPISIPRVHAHLDVTEVEERQWLDCMATALAQQDYPPSLVEYLQVQLAVPARRVREMCSAARGSGLGSTPPGR